MTETELTDSSVETLAGFQSLKSLNLDRSGISPAGIERLKQALPKARDLGRVEGDILIPPGRFGGPSNSAA